MRFLSTAIYACFIALTLTACMSPSAKASSTFSPMLQAGGDYGNSDDDELKIAALQGLLSASTERSLPLVKKVLNGDSSVEVKRKALFVLGQTEHGDAQDLLLDYASRTGSLQVEAIRMIGVGGVSSSLSKLRAIYSGASSEIQESVLQAYLIADDKSSVFRIAEASETDEEFDRAVRVLGAMDAREELRQLYERAGNRESLMQAYAVSGDLESLSRLARESGNKQQRLTAIRNIGIVGTSEAQTDLEALYRSADSDEVREAALEGMLIADHDEGVLRLFRESNNIKHKRDLMRTLVIMDSDLAIDVIDSTLSGER